MSVEIRVSLGWEMDSFRRPPKGGVELSYWDGFIDDIKEVHLEFRLNRLGDR